MPRVGRELGTEADYVSLEAVASFRRISFQAPGLRALDASRWESCSRRGEFDDVRELRV
jgi:hypothetical protein